MPHLRCFRVIYFEHGAISVVDSSGSGSFLPRRVREAAPQRSTLPPGAVEGGEEFLKPLVTLDGRLETPKDGLI